MRLYNASHSKCVAVGEVVSKDIALAALQHWGSTARLTTERLVVKISDPKVRSAFVLHAKSPPPPSASAGGTSNKRCTIGEAAPKAPRGEAGVQPMQELGAGEVEGGEVVDSVSPEFADGVQFEGMVLWDKDHMREADSYVPPLHGAVDDGGVEYTDSFSYDNLPQGKVVMGGEFFFSCFSWCCQCFCLSGGTFAFARRGAFNSTSDISCDVLGYTRVHSCAFTSPPPFVVPIRQMPPTT